MNPMQCTCGAHCYINTDLSVGQSITCFRCHDIFQRRGDNLVLMCCPPDSVRDRWRAESQADYTEES